MRFAALSLARLLWMTMGLFVLAYGIDVLRLAALGLPSWGVLHQGLSRQTLLTFGLAEIAVGLAVIGISALIGVRPSAGTVLNMLLVGIFVDAIFAYDLLPGPAAWSAYGFSAALARHVYLVGGTVLVGLGIGWYASAGMGTGPRDSMMLGLTRVSSWQVGTVRMLMDGTALGAGWLLSGDVGYGTAFSVLTIGWCIQAALWGFRRLERLPGFRALLRVPRAHARPTPPAPSRSQAGASYLRRVSSR